MWERTEMPASNYDQESKKFIKTGGVMEMTTYTFRDGFGDKLVFLSKNGDYRKLEGSVVDITLDVKLDEFTKKVRTKLLDVVPAEN